MIYLIIGAIIGAIGSFVSQRIFVAHGTLRIDHSDPEKDIYRFEIDDLDNLSKYKSIILKIRHETDLSQK